ncbi:LysR family transcriptional regulator [Permianibacter aggregans]|uniref:LysR family transcriptional regulator n=2 Tax=Permianibacter aggregans TaxID=1510150 RepID=A0A4R6UQR3_9GAMM|nr:LysR family transcriptional regulator [Permianibacter aggregans]
MVLAASVFIKRLNDNQANHISFIRYFLKMNDTDLTLFLRIAHLGNLSAAARELHLSPAVVSHRLAQLEQELGVRLFHRTTRQLSLSEDGRAFQQHAEALIEQFNEARAALSGGQQQPSGTLRLTCSASFGRQHLVPELTRFLAEHPQLQIDLQLSDHIVDLVREGFDLGIRIAPTIEPGLVARQLAASERVLCASPDYLAKHGRPEQPEDLSNHACLVLHEQHSWSFRTPNGQQKKVRVHGPLTSNHGESLRDASIEGLGISIQSRWSVHTALADGRLQTVLNDYPFDTDSFIWAVYPSGRLLPAKVRRFIDFLLKRWATPPWHAS